jgi:SAM-dependent methyltransferase
MQHLERKTEALSPPDHLCWLHYRVLEPFIIAQLRQSRTPLLDLGCGNRPYRDYYPKGQTVGADVAQSPMGCVDVLIEPGGGLPLPDDAFETVLCTQVLEHVEDPYRLLAEAHRVLRPGGRLILTCPFIWELHERPHDYLRFSEYWLQNTLTETGFELEVVQRQGGDLATIGQLICLSLDARGIHLPRFLQRLYNRFWDYLDRKSPTERMPLNYGLACVKAAGAPKAEVA